MNHRDQENEYDDIDDFLQAIWLQKSLSDNTLAAYRRDLIKTCLLYTSPSPRD